MQLKFLERRYLRLISQTVSLYCRSCLCSCVEGLTCYDLSKIFHHQKQLSLVFLRHFQITSQKHYLEYFSMRLVLVSYLSYLMNIRSRFLLVYFLGAGCLLNRRQDATFLIFRKQSLFYQYHQMMNSLRRDKTCLFQATRNPLSLNQSNSCSCQQLTDQECLIN